MQAARCPSFDCQYPANLRTNAIPTTSLLVNSDIILRLSPQICGSSQSRKSSVFRKPNMATLSSRGLIWDRTKSSTSSDADPILRKNFTSAPQKSSIKACSGRLLACGV